MSENNQNDLMLAGKVANIEEAYEFKSEHCSEKFYCVTVDSPRLSGNMDSLPVIVPSNLMFRLDVQKGDYVGVSGNIRTKHTGDAAHKNKSHLKVFGFAKDFFKLDEEDYNNPSLLDTKNSIELEGYIVKAPKIRETGTGRIITDLLLANNGKYRSNYIPTICWGSNAKMARKLKVGEKVRLTGRFQSRPYRKHTDNGDVERVAYEVSVIKIELANAQPDNEPKIA